MHAHATERIQTSAVWSCCQLQRWWLSELLSRLRQIRRSKGAAAVQILYGRRQTTLQKSRRWALLDAEEEGDGQTRYLDIEIAASSLRQVMVRGDEHETSLGRDTWRSLIPLTSLQPNCNAEGIIIRHTPAEVADGHTSNDPMHAL